MTGPRSAPAQASGAWHARAKSVTGFTHRQGNPQVELQDANLVHPESGAAHAVAVCAADGHGSPRSFRSAVGARFAVEECRSVCRELIEFGLETENHSALQDDLETRIGRQLVRSWRDRVTAHYQGSRQHGVEPHEFYPDELVALEKRSGREAVAAVRDNYHLAYGSTLLAAVATDSFMAYWQLGDGDILVAGPDGECVPVFAPDPAHIANETTSLCSPKAWEHFRWGFSKNPAPLILISTDGLSNSFENDAGFHQFGTDVYRDIRTRGVDAVAGRLNDWLLEISTRGSGDDVTVGLLCNHH